MKTALDKAVNSLDEAVSDIADGASIAVGGFGLCGVPHRLLETLSYRGVRDLHVISNNCGTDGRGLGMLASAGLIHKMTASYIGENDELVRQYLSGQLEVELVPQGTLAERLRAGGAGIPAFYANAGVGTLVADGGLPLRYLPDGSIAAVAPPKEVRSFGDRQYTLEPAITTDFALVHAARGDRYGNLSYEGSAQNFNPLCAMAGRITIAEVEKLVEPGVLDPRHIHTPGAFVQRVILIDNYEPIIENATIRSRSKLAASGGN
ncbi:CoA transferase subunit A [Nocardia aobensis]|uniref:CoA transferase subunit A n=1 Tax=Nocardia aobensis TaxID=257277 RepID=UPI0002D51F90|nr:CoA transferase subunit A [Nocardia aobensis]